MMITAETVLVRAGHAAETTVGDEVVLMTVETGECLGLGETGSAIWRLLGVRKSFGELVGELVELYEGDRAVIERGARGFVEEMVGRQLIVVSG